MKHVKVKTQKVLKRQTVNKHALKLIKNKVLQFRNSSVNLRGFYSIPSN